MPNTTSPTGRSSLPLISIGALVAGAMGLYLYRRPRLRAKMRNAESMREAASLFTKQVRHDGADAADSMIHTVSSGVSRKLRRTRAFLGRRFMHRKSAVRRGSPIKIAARHAKNEVKHLARAAQADVRHAAKHGQIEAEHLMDEMKEARDLSANRAANV